MPRNSAFFLLIMLSLRLGAVNISVEVASGCSKLYLASYYAKGVQVLDSLLIRDGKAVLTREHNLPEGVYFLADGPKGDRFDFLIGADQDFDIVISSFKPSVGSVTGAIETESFRRYQSYVEETYKTKEEKIAYTRKAYADAEDGSVLQLILKAMLPPEEDGNTSLLVVNGDASLHFWENYDLSDGRLVRTPFFAQRIDYFLYNVLSPREDKIMAGMLPLLERAEQNEEVLKIVASAALGFAVQDDIMGIDALGYEVISRYYLSGRFGELSDKQQRMLVDYARHTANCRVGHQGRDIRLDALEKEKGEVSLYAMDAPYILLLFWEPDCDYCKVMLPVLRDDVYAKYQDKGLKVFAVNTQRDYEMWKNYLIKNELFDWTHGYLAVGESDFMVDYGIQGTPYMIILDKDKNIVAKNVKLDFINQLLERLFATGSIY